MLTTPTPSLRSLYSVYASLSSSHGPSSSGDRYVFYATDVGNAAYLGVLNLSSLQLSVRTVPQLSDWTEMACDSTMYTLLPPLTHFWECFIVVASFFASA